MGLTRMGPPQELIEQLAEHLTIPLFIETGTYRGDTAYWASKHFAHVATIENAQELFEEASRKYQFVQNINFVYGDSRTELHAG